MHTLLTLLFQLEIYKVKLLTLLLAVSACMRACVRACVRAYVSVSNLTQMFSSIQCIGRQLQRHSYGQKHHPNAASTRFCSCNMNVVLLLLVLARPSPPALDDAGIWPRLPSPTRRVALAESWRQRSSFDALKSGTQRPSVASQQPR